VNRVAGWGPLGVTLVELLVASGISILVLMGLTTSLVLGGAAWRRMQGTSAMDVAVALERFQSEFVNSPTFPGIPFMGEPTRTAFPALINQAPPGEGPSWIFGRIEYLFDVGSRSLSVQKQPYGAFLSGATPASPERLVPGVKEVRLEYLKLDPVAGASVWGNSWDSGSGQIPWAIRITLVMEGRFGQEAVYVKSGIRPLDS
jgi:hypothetical protein